MEWLYIPGAIAIIGMIWTQGAIIMKMRDIDEQYERIFSSTDREYNQMKTRLDRAGIPPLREGEDDITIEEF